MGENEVPSDMNQDALKGHTVHRFDQELTHLHALFLEMGGLVRTQLGQSLKALDGKDLALAHKVILQDNDVDALEKKSDEETVRLLARRGPVGRDLRLVVAVTKAVTDLERIGDEASKIADITLALYDNDTPDPNAGLLRDVAYMGELAIGMLDRALQAFEHIDAQAAARVAAGQTELDDEFSDSMRRLVTYILEDGRNVGHAIRVVLAMKALERVGDHAKNIAEFVTYLVSGQDIRHQHPPRETLPTEESGQA
jgi:phosphate transport system protein